MTNSRGHFFTQVAPKLYFPSGLMSTWYVVGLYSMSGGQVSLHVASSRNFRHTCVRGVRMGASPRGTALQAFSLEPLCRAAGHHPIGWAPRSLVSQRAVSGDDKEVDVRTIRLKTRSTV